ncbi:MAG: vanadium-dependent haloperoxidase [Anaerolineae bacterium]|nr:vanadium-dependent haloperoxidase [Anaerolineae bacterium]
MVLFLVVGLLTACQPAAAPSRPASDYPAAVAISWFELQLELIQDTPGFTPPVASRALGYAGLTLYETVVEGMPGYKSQGQHLVGVTSLPRTETGRSYHWAAAANSALATIVRSLYPTASPDNLAAIDALEHEFATQYKPEAGQAVFDRSSAHGRAVAEAIFEWSKTDGGHEGYARNFPEDLAPDSGPGLWVPTPPDFQAALQPYWGHNRPFVISGQECAPPPPPEYSKDPSSQFYADGMEVYTTVKNLTPEQTAIALFWADDPGKTFTPPGHALAIATQVLRAEQAALSLAAETYAKVGMAVADAFIGCWSAKYTYNLVRPITYIQSVIDPAWNLPDVTDPVVTPPFPEYPSGHSVQIGAAATVMTALFGDPYHFTDNSHAEHGLPARTFDSFFAAADQAALSRLYGGIHYRPAIELGLVQGRCIGEKINSLSWKE